MEPCHQNYEYIGISTFVEIFSPDGEPVGMDAFNRTWKGIDMFYGHDAGLTIGLSK